MVSNLKVLEAAEEAYKELLAASKKKTASKKSGTAGKEDTTVQTEKVQAFMEQMDALTEASLLNDLLDAVAAYEALTEEEKQASALEDRIEELKTLIADSAHTDAATGIAVSGVEWNVQIVIEDIPEETEIQEMQEKLGNSMMLGVWNISLVDLLTGEKVEPSEAVLVKIPLELLGDFSAYDGLTVVHYTKDGTAEYLNCTVVGDCIVFNTAEFSHYAVAGYYGTSPMEGAAALSGNAEENGSAAWIPWTIAGGCSAVLLAVLLILANKNRKNVQAGE